MISGFIPTEEIIIMVHDPKAPVINGKSLLKHIHVKVLFIDIRGTWPDGTIGIDMYYAPNFAKFKRISQSELENISGYHNGARTSENYFEMFYKSVGK